MTAWRGSTPRRRTSNSRLSRKPGSQPLFASRGKPHDPRFGLAVGPAARNNMLQDRGAKGSTEMTAALTPIEARLTERPPAPFKRIDIEARLGEKAPTFGGHTSVCRPGGQADGARQSGRTSSPQDRPPDDRSRSARDAIPDRAVRCGPASGPRGPPPASEPRALWQRQHRRVGSSDAGPGARSRQAPRLRAWPDIRSRSRG